MSDGLSRVHEADDGWHWIVAGEAGRRFEGVAESREIALRFAAEKQREWGESSFTGDQLQAMYALEQIVGAPENGHVHLINFTDDSAIVEIRRDGFHVGVVGVSPSGQLWWVP